MINALQLQVVSPKRLAVPSVDHSSCEYLFSTGFNGCFRAISCVLHQIKLEVVAFSDIFLTSVFTVETVGFLEIVV